MSHIASDHTFYVEPLWLICWIITNVCSGLISLNLIRCKSTASIIGFDPVRPLKFSGRVKRLYLCLWILERFTHGLLVSVLTPFWHYELLWLQWWRKWWLWNTVWSNLLHRINAWYFLKVVSLTVDLCIARIIKGCVMNRRFFNLLDSCWFLGIHLKSNLY